MAFKRSGVRFPSAPPVKIKDEVAAPRFFCFKSSQMVEGKRTPEERGLTTNERRAEERRSAKPMSARAAEALKAEGLSPQLHQLR